ncbi:uncharacterized protein [Haliotis cracherodii]|uniref:uncharacterized protein n=1 Tax=Haliotis cracherodii TaxID=6455 RepID=UPI0039E8BD6A
MDVAAFCPLLEDIGTLCIVLAMTAGVLLVRLREDWQRYRVACVCILIAVLCQLCVGHFIIERNAKGHATAKDIWISAGGDFAAAIHSGFYKRVVDMIMIARVYGLIGLTVLLTVIILQGNLFLGIGVLGLLFLLVSIII